MKFSFLKEDIKRFELNDTLAFSILAAGVGSLLPSPANLFLVIPALFYIWTEIRISYFIYAGVVLLPLANVGKITHMDILNIPSSIYYLISLITISIGLFFMAFKNGFQFNKIYLVISIVVFLTGIFLKVSHMDLFNVPGNLVLIWGTLLVIASYFYRFILKSNKTAEDVIKVLLVASLVITYTLSVLHLNFAMEVSIAKTVLLFLWIGIYFTDKKKAAPPDDILDL